jgi:hypothetical protein
MRWYGISRMRSSIVRLARYAEIGGCSELIVELLGDACQIAQSGPIGMVKATDALGGASAMVA